MLRMMYFDDAKNIAEYIKMADGNDGREFIPILRAHLENDATVLELGMGPGKDLKLLSKYFRVTGSDQSQLFIDHVRAAHPNTDLLWLDASTLETERKFDCIYSNKVLHHLTKSQLEESFQNQAKILNPGGMCFHTFWYGDSEEEYSGLRFVYYTPENLLKLLGDEFEAIELNMYTEIEAGDSFYILLRKKEQTKPPSDQVVKVNELETQ